MKIQRKNRENLKFDRRRAINFWVLVTGNVLAALVFVFSFRYYVNNINEQQEQKNIAAIENTTGTLTETFGNFLLSQTEITKAYANYIESSDLSYEEAEKYLFSWKDFYKGIAIIDTNTSIGKVMAPQTTTLRHEFDFSTQKWFRTLSKTYDKENGSDVKVTEVFEDSDKETYDVAFYAPVNIQGKQYLVLFFLTTDDLIRGGMNIQGIESRNGLLLTKTGKILMGELAGIKDAVGINFFEYFDGRGGILNSETIKKNIKMNGEYTFEVKDTGVTNARFVCIAKTVPHTNGWIYIYNATEEEFGTGDNAIKMQYFVFIFLAAWFGIVILFYVLYNNIIKESFEIIEKQNEDLKYASNAKTSFVSNVSHELRTPINAVLGMNEMILKESTEDNIKEYAYDVRSAGKALLSVINDVLDFSKIESGKMEIVDAEYSLENIVKEVHTLIQLRAEQKKLNFIINVSPSVPRVLVGDDVHIKQIIINLLTNAVKYTDKGTVTLKINSEKVDNKVMMYVEVSDTGKGMKPEEMHKLYEEYGRLDMKTNRNTEGTGLGIPIVRKLLVLMGSEMKVESEYGVGSKFYFNLFQDVKDWTPIGGLNFYNNHDGRDAIENSVTVRQIEGKVLAVDDTALNLKVLKALLKDTKLEIDTCDSGIRALKMCDDVKYDLIFLDHRMPGMDGIETNKRIKESSLLNKDTPTVALTANVVSGAKEMYIGEGFVDFLSKPINIGALNECIEKYFNKGEENE